MAKVFEQTSSGTYDVVCPKCGTVLRSPYKGKMSSLNIRCNKCSTRLEEYSAVVVEHGEDPPSPRECQTTLRNYWERISVGEMKKQRFRRAANDIGIYEYLD